MSKSIYKKIYDNIITNAFNEDRKKCNDVYYEKHHIIPKSLGGSDDESNMVLLTVREHIIAHWLLWKTSIGNDKYKMAVAFHCACNMCHADDPIYKKYAIIEQSKLANREWTIKYHTGKKRSSETCKNISQSLRGRSLSNDHKNSLRKAWENMDDNVKANRNMAISKALKGKKKPITHGLNVSKALTGQRKKSNHKKALSKSVKLYYDNKPLHIYKFISPDNNIYIINELQLKKFLLKTFSNTKPWGFVRYSRSKKMSKIVRGEMKGWHIQWYRFAEGFKN